jgi:hypothetical protein
LSAWHRLCETGVTEQIEAFIEIAEADLAKIRAGKPWASS